MLCKFAVSHGRSKPLPYPVAVYIYGNRRKPSLGGRGRLPSSEGEMSAKPTEGSEAYEVGVNGDTVRRQSRRETEPQRETGLLDRLRWMRETYTTVLMG